MWIWLAVSPKFFTSLHSAYYRYIFVQILKFLFLPSKDKVSCKIFPYKHLRRSKLNCICGIICFLEYLAKSTVSYEVPLSGLLFHIRSCPPHLWTYSNCCQVSAGQMEHSISICVERSKQNRLNFICDLTSCDIYN